MVLIVPETMRTVNETWDLGPGRFPGHQTTMSSGAMRLTGLREDNMLGCHSRYAYPERI